MKRLILLVLSAVVLFTGCSNKTLNIEESPTNTTVEENTENENKEPSLSDFASDNISENEINFSDYISTEVYSFTEEDIEYVDDVIKAIVDKGDGFKGFEYIKGNEIEEKIKDECLIVFVSDYCRPCKYYKTVLFSYNNINKDIPLYLVNVADETNKEYLERFNIDATPITMYFRKSNSAVLFKGIRTYDELIKFIDEFKEN